MGPIKLVVATVLFTMLALVVLRADAQNGLGSSLDVSATAASSSSGADSETRAGSSGDSTLDSRWLQFESSSTETTRTTTSRDSTSTTTNRNRSNDWILSGSTRYTGGSGAAAAPRRYAAGWIETEPPYYGGWITADISSTPVRNQAARLQHGADAGVQ
jgi:hypothetical protein